MSINKLMVEIVLPVDLMELSAGSLKLCELFTGALIKSEKNLINLFVEIPGKSVRCNDPVVKEVVGLFIGSGRFREFAKQQTLLLHKSSLSGILGELHYICDGEVRKFVFSGSIEKTGWRITRNSVGAN